MTFLTKLWLLDTRSLQTTTTYIICHWTIERQLLYNYHIRCFIEEKFGSYYLITRRWISLQRSLHQVNKKVLKVTTFYQVYILDYRYQLYSVPSFCFHLFSLDITIIITTFELKLGSSIWIKNVQIICFEMPPLLLQV